MNYLIAYDPADGEIKACFWAAGSQELADKYNDAGLEVMAAERVEPGSWLVQEGALVPRPEPDLAQLKAQAKQRLDQDYTTYAQEKYPLEWRDGAREFRELFRQVSEDSQSTTGQTDAANQGLAILAGLQDWLFKEILVYYSAKCDAIAAAQTAAELPDWDFAAALDASDPGVSMASDLVPLAVQAGVLAASQS